MSAQNLSGYQLSAFFSGLAISNFCSRYGSTVLSNELLDTKIDTKSLRTYAAVQAAFGALFFLAIRRLVEKQCSIQGLSCSKSIVGAATVGISLAVGALFGKCMTDLCNKKPMTWDQALKIVSIQLPITMGFEYLGTAK